MMPLIQDGVAFILGYDDEWKNLERSKYMFDALNCQDLMNALVETRHRRIELDDLAGPDWAL